MELCTMVLVFFLSSVAGEETCEKTVLNDYHRLLKDIDRNTSDTLVPSSNGSTPLSVLTYSFLMNYNEVWSGFEIVMWVAVSWKDDGISWDPAQYSNISLVSPSLASLWKPQFQMATENSQRSIAINSFLTLTFRGVVHTKIEGGVFADCQSDVTAWPHDTKICTFPLRLIHDAKSVNFVHNAVDKLESSPIVETLKEWILVNATLRFDDAANSQIYTVTLRRGSGTYTSIVTTPIAISILMILLSFWINPMEAYRLVLLLVSIAIHLSYLQYIGSVVPHSEDKNINIVVYVQNSTIMCCFAIVLLSVVKAMVQTTATLSWVTYVYNQAKKWRVATYLLIFEGSTIYNSEDENGEFSKGSKTKKEWILISAIIDRFAFTVYLITYVVMFYEYVLASFY